jgi:hypothetical protein
MQMQYWTDDDLPEAMIYIWYHLSPEHNLLRRWWNAVRYLFGYRSRYGDFGEVCLDLDEARVMWDFLTGFVENYEEPEEWGLWERLQNGFW